MTSITEKDEIQNRDVPVKAKEGIKRIRKLKPKGKPKPKQKQQSVSISKTLPDFLLPCLYNDDNLDLPDNVHKFLDKVDVRPLGWEQNTRLANLPKANILKILEILEYDITRPQIKPSSLPLPSSSSLPAPPANRHSPPPRLPSTTLQTPKPLRRSATSLGILNSSEHKVKIWRWLLSGESEKEELKEDEKDTKQDKLEPSTEEDTKKHEEKKAKLKNLILKTKRQIEQEVNYWERVFAAARLKDDDAECIAELIREEEQELKKNKFAHIWTAEEFEAHKLILPDNHHILAAQAQLQKRINELDLLNHPEAVKQKLDKAKSREAKMQSKMKIVYPYFSEYVQESAKIYQRFQKCLSEFLNIQLQRQKKPITTPEIRDSDPKIS
jgi:hypothetical protein